MLMQYLCNDMNKGKVSPLQCPQAFPNHPLEEHHDDAHEYYTIYMIAPVAGTVGQAWSMLLVVGLSQVLI